MKLKIMISLMLLVVLSLMATISHAQSPQKFNYQGIARDTKGNPLSNQKMSLKLSVLPTADATVAEYEETQNVVTNEFGLYTLQIGNGTVLTGTMKDVKWETGNKYIKVAIDAKGGTDFVDIGTSQLLSVPYALYADKSGSATTTHGGTRTGTVASNATHVAGDANYVTKFTALNTIGKSSIYDNGNFVGIGTTTQVTPLFKFQLQSADELNFMEKTTSPSKTANFRLWNSDNKGLEIYQYGSAGPGTYMGLPRANLSLFNSNTGTFAFNASGDLVFGNNATPRLYIQNGTGNIGIGTGTTAPAAKLDVNGQVRIQGGTPGVGKVLTSDATGLATWSTPTGGSGMSNGNAIGDMLYWSGTQWTLLPVGSNGQTLTVNNGIPTWGSSATLPSVTTSNISSISNISCSVGGDVTNNGGSTVTARGFCYNTSPNPTLANMVVTNGSGLGGFSSTIGSLTAGITYYIRAYATNASGTAYGNTITFATTSNTPYTIGLNGPAGGYVFYDKGSYTNGWRYLECAPYDQSTGIIWGCNGTSINGLTNSLGDGYSNTNTILVNCSSNNIAAYLCDTLTLNGFSDWFLPDENEIGLMKDNLYSFNIGNFTNNYYWTSYSNASTVAYSWIFTNNYSSNTLKNSLNRVRAVRRF